MSEVIRVMLEQLEIRDIAPQKVFFISDKLTFREMVENVIEIRTNAYEEAEGNICVLADELSVSPEMMYELCYPSQVVNLKLRKQTEYKVLQRIKAVCCIYTGKSDELQLALNKLKEYAEEQGYEIEMPFRYVYSLTKRKLFSKKEPTVTMGIQIPIKKK